MGARRGYEACGHITSLTTPDAPLVWEAVSAALTGSPLLETRSTRELVTILNVEDATVAGAVAEAGDVLAVAIEQISARIARGGRLGYVGAGTSGRLAALDAAECGPTFGSPPGEVDAALAAAGGDARVALVSLLAGVDPSIARERLDGSGGSVRLALGGSLGGSS